jgi:hypothetical protein
MPMQMSDGQNRCDLSLHDEEHPERKPVDNGPPKLLKNEWKKQRTFLDSPECCPKFNEEFRPKSLSLTVVPWCRFQCIEFCLRPNSEQGHLPTGAEAMLNSFKNLLPRSGVFRISAMRGKTLFQQGLLPLLEWNLVDICCDVIPERLHVVDLVFDWHRVEP